MHKNIYLYINKWFQQLKVLYCFGAPARPHMATAGWLAGFVVSRSFGKKSAGAK